MFPFINTLLFSYTPVQYWVQSQQCRINFRERKSCKMFSCVLVFTLFSSRNLSLTETSLRIFSYFSRWLWNWICDCSILGSVVASRGPRFSSSRSVRYASYSILQQRERDTDLRQCLYRIICVVLFSPDTAFCLRITEDLHIFTPHPKTCSFSSGSEEVMMHLFWTNYKARHTEKLSRRPLKSYLAASYCLMLIMVSSMVLSTSVLTLAIKKLMAPKRVSPFLDRSFWVSAL